MEMFLAPCPMVYIYFVVLECILMLMTSTTETFLTAKLFKQGYKYHKFEKHFLNSSTAIQSLLLNITLVLKTLLQQGISEPMFYGDLVNKFKKTNCWKI